MLNRQIFMRNLHNKLRTEPVGLRRVSNTPQSKSISFPYLMCQRWCYWLVPATPRNIRAPGKVVADHHTPKIFQHRGRREEKRKTRVYVTLRLGNLALGFLCVLCALCDL